MKSKFVLAAVFVLLLCVPSFAQEFPPCVQGTLAKYIALGEGGCMFQSALYDNFTYVAAVSNAPTPDEITVTPVPGPIIAGYFIGLNFSANWEEGPGGSQQSIINYRVVPFPPGSSANSGQLTLDLGPSSVNGIIGSVTVAENTNVGDLLVYDKCNEVCSIMNKDQLTFTPIQTINVSDNISVAGGTNGASFSLFANDTNFCPECAQPQ
jgi:hypothetical protein